MSTAPDQGPCPSPESVLVARLRAGDPASREHLVRTYAGRMLAVIRRIVCDEDDACDCLQEAFMQALRGIERFEERAALGTWLHRIAVNAALVHVRRRRRRREQSIDDLLPRFEPDGLRVEDQPAPSPDAALEREQTVALVRRAVERLPESYRIVLALRDIEGYDTDETAALLETTSGAVKVRLHRARSALKKLLESSIRESRQE